MTLKQLSKRQQILSDVLSFDNEDGRFNYVIGELQRIANKIPYAKKEEYYKERQDNFKYFQDEWNNK